MSTFIDLSLPLTPKANPRSPVEFTYLNHEQTANAYASVYGIQPDGFPEGKYCAIEKIKLTTHDTTHMDAPYHFWPTSEGKPSRTIDQIPLGMVLRRRGGAGFPSQANRRKHQRPGGGAGL